MTFEIEILSKHGRPCLQVKLYKQHLSNVVGKCFTLTVLFYYGINYTYS